jgi:hypothetical protein
MNESVAGSDYPIGTFGEQELDGGHGKSDGNPRGASLERSANRTPPMK